jgi:hypothetical protein
MADAAPSVFATRLEGAAPALEVAHDLARRALMVAPAVLLIAGLFWGGDGVASAAIALALVAGNFVLAAQIMAWASRISLAMLYGAVMGGYVLRLIIVTAVFYLFHSFAWFDVIPFAITLVVTHLGLLTWETRYISHALAYPGLKPRPAD